MVLDSKYVAINTALLDCKPPPDVSSICVDRGPFNFVGNGDALPFCSYSEDADHGVLVTRLLR